jgi:two-component system, OmpR family, KDP operon response regulator KdpE
MTKAGEHVLVVDDEPQILRALGVILRNAGYEVATAATKSEALDAVSVRPPDAMVLDLVLPDGSGVDVTSEVRTWSSLPIIVLSAVGDEREKVLLARLRAVLRRATDERDEPVLSVGALAIDLADRRVTRDGEEIHLTPIEFDILRELAHHAGKLVTQRQLLQAVWGPGYDLETHYLRVHVAHIRAKIEPDPSHPSYVVTEPGVGYRLREPAP